MNFFAIFSKILETEFLHFLYPYWFLNNIGNLFTQRTLQRKSHFSIPFLGIVRPQSKFPHSWVCERFILYMPRNGPHISRSRIGRLIVEYISRSQTHECRNYCCGRAIHFLGIFVSNFRYWFISVDGTIKRENVKVTVFQAKHKRG